MFPIKSVIPKSLEVGHWLSEHLRNDKNNNVLPPMISFLAFSGFTFFD